MVLDFFISVIVLIIDNTVVRFFPDEIPGLTLTQFESGFGALFSGFQNAFNLFLAEFMLHFGFKGIKWLINIVRGSGA
jgi:hypothetical protein